MATINYDEVPVEAIRQLYNDIHDELQTRAIEGGIDVTDPDVAHALAEQTQDQVIAGIDMLGQTCST